MLRLEMLPAGPGDCLWLEYGTPGATRIVIIDGGVRDTVAALQRRIVAACKERGRDTLEVELLVVTHIDNDHIQGILELLKPEQCSVQIKDIWFNGRPQLMNLPAQQANTRSNRRSAAASVADTLGSDDEYMNSWVSAESTLDSPADLLGRQEGDALSELLQSRPIPWNAHAAWHGNAIAVPNEGDLPTALLDGNLQLTLLGPGVDRLHKLCTVWTDVLGGSEESSELNTTPVDLLGRSDEWPPSWKEEEKHDSSAANGSSIMLLAEYEGEALLLAGDGYGPDLVKALDRLRTQRGSVKNPVPVSAFKLPHHGSEKNLSKAVLNRIDCRRYLISTDGTSHGHPDQQAILRILRYSRSMPELYFNYSSETTQPWSDHKSEIVDADFQDYQTLFPMNNKDGISINLK